MNFDIPLISKKNNRDLWASRYSEIDLLNQEILESLKNRAGVYGIFAAKPGEEWQLKYIGQTNASGSKQRIRSHIVWRNKATNSGKFTGSKFDEVQKAVSRKFEIAISFVEIEPDSLRHYIEETLIKKKEPSWNFNGTSISGQQKSERRCIL